MFMPAGVQMGILAGNYFGTTAWWTDRLGEQTYWESDQPTSKSADRLTSKPTAVMSSGEQKALYACI